MWITRKGKLEPTLSSALPPKKHTDLDSTRWNITPSQCCNICSQFLFVLISQWTGSTLAWQQPLVHPHFGQAALFHICSNLHSTTLWSVSCILQTRTQGYAWSWNSGLELQLTHGGLCDFGKGVPSLSWLASPFHSICLWRPQAELLYNVILLHVGSGQWKEKGSGDWDCAFSQTGIR